MIQVTLTNDEAIAFRLFREHQDFYMTLIAQDLHKLSNGSALLNFDEHGSLRKIRLEQVVYKV